jgi:predicted nucleic acid-binding Zn ribbon protein
MNHCLDCGAELEGRADKKFCSDHCKSSYHYECTKRKAASMFKTIDAQLKKNRQLLKFYNQAGKATVRKEVLIEKGFNPRYFTHFWKARNGNVYFFCYEYGFMKKVESNKEKFVLVQYQDYMK